MKVDKKLSADFIEQGFLLGKENGILIKNPIQIFASFSLYNEWAEYRSATLINTKKDYSIKCSLSWDTDEVIPSELYIKPVSNKDFQNLTVEDDIQIFFEVFNVCYYFKTKIIDAENFNDKIIVQIPEEIKVIKRRLFPRVDISSIKSNAYCMPRNSTEKIEILIQEIGVNTLKVTAVSFLTLKDGIIKIDDLSIGFKVIERKKDLLKFEYCLSLEFNNNINFGKYFEIYAKYAFPTLKSRSEFNINDVLEIYNSTGFFNKFVKNESQEDEFFTKINSTWSQLNNAQHSGVTDYCSEVEEGRIVGCSSLARAFYNESKPVWVMQQLCVLSNPEYFLNTRDLYLWRPIYLSALKEDFDVACWFDGNSRWIERIWIKFALNKGNISETLWPVDILICQLDKKDSTASVNADDKLITTYKFGNLERSVFIEKNLIAGSDPACLNFANLLDHIVAIPPSDRDFEFLLNKAKKLFSLSEEGTKDFRISVDKSNLPSTHEKYRRHDLNRFCYFNKNDLSFLFTSIEHSIAVMSKKYKQKNF